MADHVRGVSRIESTPLYREEQKSLPPHRAPLEFSTEATGTQATGNLGRFFMDHDALYAAYVEWCRKLKIKPATKEEYFRVTGKF